MLMRSRFSLGILLALLSACATTPPIPAPTAAVSERPTTLEQPGVVPNKLPVVATFSVIADMTRTIGGDLVAITTLVGPGGDAHTFEPTPEDGKALAGAKVIFENGIGFESFLNDLYTASGSQATRVVLSAGVALQPIAAADQGQNSAKSENDPHIWHNVQNAIIMAEHITAGLATADPANAAIYQANGAKYMAALQELDSFIQQQVAQLPAERRKLITSHDTFGYFAARYGFQIVGTALASASTEASDPSPATIANLIKGIKAAGVPAIFAENVSNPKLMQTIADEAGVKLAPTLYTDALGEPGSAGATYIEMMRSNATTIVMALKG
jgi:ABC-type Zn uptake system ZnuABC Zn-binding protein ZnuA